MKKWSNLFILKEVSNKESTKFSVSCTHFIKTHFINELFKLKNIVCK